MRRPILPWPGGFQHSGMDAPSSPEVFHSPTPSTGLAAPISVKPDSWERVYLAALDITTNAAE